MNKSYQELCDENQQLREDLDDARGIVIKCLNTGLIARNERKRVEEQEEALAAHQDDLVRELSACQGVLHHLARSGEVTKQYADDAKTVLDRTEEASLAHRDARVAAKAMRQVADWMDAKSESCGGPSGHEAESIGMEISGPTQCSAADRCYRAGMRAFQEAARIWEYRAAQAEGGAQ